MLQIQSYKHKVLLGVCVGLLMLHSGVPVRCLQIHVPREFIAQAYAACSGSVVNFFSGILSRIRLVPVIAALQESRELLSELPPEIEHQGCPIR